LTAGGLRGASRQRPSSVSMSLRPGPRRTPGPDPALMRCGPDLDAVPERDAVLDLADQERGLGVVPDRVLAGHALDVDRVVGRDALPRAHRVGAAGLDVLAPQR